MRVQSPALTSLRQNISYAQFIIGVSHIIIIYVLDDLLSVHQHTQSVLKRSCVMAQHTGHHIVYKHIVYKHIVYKHC